MEGLDREALSSLKVTQLKVPASLFSVHASKLTDPGDAAQDRLKRRGLPVSGKKDELIDRLLDHPAQAETAGAEVAANPTSPSAQPPESANVHATPPKASLPVSPSPVAGPSEPSVPETRSPPKAVRTSLQDAWDEGQSRSPKRQRLSEPRTNGDAAPGPSGGSLESPDVARSRPDADNSKVQKEGEEEDDDEDDDDVLPGPGSSPLKSSDLYLDTINRDMLDFDFERLCSVTLSNINIYACLACGKYFQGRGKTSPAYAHSIGEDHHVYINLQSQAVYVLPDGYEVSDPSLDDVKYLLNPTFQPGILRRLDSGSSGPSYDLHSAPYLPGFVGLNNIKANDYLNVVVHALAHVVPLRDYFVFNSSSGAFDREGSSELVKRFGMLVRKIWNPRAFKAQVSPHEFGQEVSSRSDRRFRLTQQADPLEFLGWLLNTLHRDLGGSKRAGSSIIYSAFQGEVRIDDQDVVVKPDSGESVKPTFDLAREVHTTRHPFLFLTIDLPAPPVFQDSIEKNIIPQVSLSAVLAKYNGHTTQELPGKLRRHRCTRLPPFLLLHIKRFTSNNFVDEKNPTIVNFPTRGVDVTDCLEPSPEDVKENAAPISQIYDLVANITYSSAAGSAKEDAQWKVQVHTRPLRDREGNLVKNEAGVLEEEKWFQVQDLIVEEVNRQMVFLGESYIQVWERRNTPRELPVFPRKAGAAPRPRQ